MRVCGWEQMRLTQPARFCGGEQLEYAVLDAGGRGAARADNARERERLKEWLEPWMKETVSKLLKEERDYYKSRPTQAARYYGGIFQPGYMEALLTPVVARKVYGQVEERLRLETVRKGR